MNLLLWTVTVLNTLIALAALGLMLVVSRRYREIHAMVSGGGTRLPLPGSGVPDFAVTTTDGHDLDQDDLAGPDRLIAFLLSGCEPCAAQLPGLRRAFAALPDDGLRPLVVVSGENAEPYAAELGPYAYVVEGEQARQVAEAFGVTAFPTLVETGGGAVHKVGGTVAEIGLDTLRGTGALAGPGASSGTGTGTGLGTAAGLDAANGLGAAR
ncbi:redoxin domain-containing protein [Streptosporangiaceae bacterium NEAU-GS5]|nr:redoxin domain-containing protein [Streptosporangiaceae bacterium NEAU-GS5]